MYVCHLRGKTSLCTGMPLIMYTLRDATNHIYFNEKHNDINNKAISTESTNNLCQNYTENLIK